MAKIRLILFCFSRFLAASLESVREPSERGKRRSRGAVGEVRRGRNGVTSWVGGCLSQSCTDGGQRSRGRESEGGAYGLRVDFSLDNKSTDPRERAL